MKFNYQATGVGSVPLTEARAACEMVFKNFPDIPFWPQLPRRSYLESMYVQYAERLPGVVVNEAAKTIHIDSRKAVEGIEEVYAKYLENDLDYFRITESRSLGFYAFLEMMKAGGHAPAWVKGGLTGPVSFGLSVTDENKRAILYDKDMAEVLTKLLVMKARWQVARLKECCPNVIIFIDEPYLISIGSSYITINVEDAAAKLDEVIAAIKEAGALAGVHCCGNTDWSILLKRDLDILSFDAYEGAREFSLYSDEIKAFTKRGGTVAWGIIPSSDAIEKETKQSLVDRSRAALAFLEQKGISPDSVSSLITPSCGVGSLSEPLAKRILEMTRAVSDELRSK